MPCLRRLSHRADCLLNRSVKRGGSPWLTGSFWRAGTLPACHTDIVSKMLLLGDPGFHPLAQCDVSKPATKAGAKSAAFAHYGGRSWLNTVLFSQQGKPKVAGNAALSGWAIRAIRAQLLPAAVGPFHSSLRAVHCHVGCPIYLYTHMIFVSRNCRYISIFVLRYILQ